jgi:hypothetical protein
MISAFVLFQCGVFSPGGAGAIRHQQEEEEQPIREQRFPTLKE